MTLATGSGPRKPSCVENSNMLRPANSPVPFAPVPRTIDSSCMTACESFAIFTSLLAVRGAVAQTIPITGVRVDPLWSFASAMTALMANTTPPAALSQQHGTPT